jgi:pilus assembly protein CpaB
MDTKRLVVLGLALVAASGAAFMARGLMGGGTPKVEAKPAPAPVAMSQVLVAGVALQPGQKLTADQVRWEKWPASAVDSAFITHNTVASEDEAVKGTVVRVPLLAGQPITTAAIVHADAAGFLAAMINPGMRAVSITISTDSGAGGFILPNDRVDLILTQKSSETPPRVRAKTILNNVRVLAVDQTFKQEKDTKTVIGKTATLELTPSDAELVAKAQDQGTVSLSLRPLGESADDVAANAPPRPANNNDDDSIPGSNVSVIRYGVTHDNDAKQKGILQ